MVKIIRKDIKEVRRSKYHIHLFIKERGGFFSAPYMTLSREQTDPTFYEEFKQGDIDVVYSEDKRSEKLAIFYDEKSVWPK